MSKNPDPKKEKPKKSSFREFIEAVVMALVLALLLRANVIQAFKIPSGSMIPTLLIGDHLLANKFIYGFNYPFTNTKMFTYNHPKCQDIIVFRYPKNPDVDFIKRVIGTGGDKVEIRDKVVYVNDKPLDEPYKYHSDPRIDPKKVPQDSGEFMPSSKRDNFGPIYVPKDCLFVMGDNRDQSLDSRYWGYVKESEVKGRALIIYWSWLKWRDRQPYENEVSYWGKNVWDSLLNFPNRVRWSRFARIIS